MSFDNCPEFRSDVWLATRLHDNIGGALMVLTYEGHECIEAKVCNTVLSG